MRSETSNFHRQDILHRTFSPLLAAPPMPAKNAQFDIEFFPEGLAEYELRHNPGHDLLRMPKWCAEAQLEKFNAVFAAYSRNPIAILLGAAAIEGYTNYAGHNVCKDWEEFVEGNRRFSEKLRHLFSTGKKAAKLSHRSYQDTMALFKFRGCLAHPRFNHHKEVREGPRRYSLITSMSIIPLRKYSKL